MTFDPAALRSLLAAATPGPWLGPRITDVWPPGCLGLYALDEYGEPAEIIGFTGYADEDGRAEHDAEPVAAAINALPELLAVYEAACVAVDANRRCDTGLDDHADAHLAHESDVAFVALCTAVDAARKASRDHRHRPPPQAARCGDDE